MFNNKIYSAFICHKPSCIYLSCTVWLLNHRIIIIIIIIVCITYTFVLFTVAQLEHVEHSTDVGAQGSDMGRVVHAKRRWCQRSTKRGFDLDRGRGTVPGHGNWNRRDAVPRISGGRWVGPVRLSEPSGVRATGAGGELSQDSRNGLENRENVWRVRYTRRSN